MYRVARAVTQVVSKHRCFLLLKILSCGSGSVIYKEVTIPAPSCQQYVRIILSRTAICETTCISSTAAKCGLHEGSHCWRQVQSPHFCPAVQHIFLSQHHGKGLTEKEQQPRTVRYRVRSRPFSPLHHPLTGLALKHMISLQNTCNLCEKRRKAGDGTRKGSLLYVM